MDHPAPPPAARGAAVVPDGFAPRPLGGGFLQAHGPLYIGRDPEGRTVFGLRVEAHHCNAQDNCHGGMLATLADVVLGIGECEHAGAPGFFVTISLTTDFLAPAPLDAWVECQLELLRATRSMAFVQGVFAVEGRPVLRASAGCSGCRRGRGRPRGGRGAEGAPPPPAETNHAAITLATPS